MYFLPNLRIYSSITRHLIYTMLNAILKLSVLRFLFFSLDIRNIVTFYDDKLLFNIIEAIYFVYVYMIIFIIYRVIGIL